MIIDCHGHYTTVPEAHTRWRQAQLDAWAEGRSAPPYPDISDEEIRVSVENTQLRLQAERGTDLTIFSPRASAMAHHQGDIATSTVWAAACNDLIARVASMFPSNFAPSAQLPQTAGAPLDKAVEELHRVARLGFVGAILNPDPSGGRWSSPPITDRYWYLIYEALCELDLPAMIHVSASCTPVFHSTGAHYLNADTTAFTKELRVIYTAPTVEAAEAAFEEFAEKWEPI